MDEENEPVVEPHQTMLEARGVLPSIYEGVLADMPQGFNAVSILVDGRMQSDLDWSTARQKAEKAVASDLAILWDIQLGLFDQLHLPLSNQTQFISIGLSLEHFRDTLGKDFAAHTLGISLYRGGGDFSDRFPWDEEQIANWVEWRTEKSLSAEDEPFLKEIFCRDAAVEYLSLLAARLPDHLPSYLFLSVASLAKCPLKQLQLLNPDRFENFSLILDGVTLPFDALGWRSAPMAKGFAGLTPMPMPKRERGSIGICIPLMDACASEQWEGFDKAIEALQHKKLPFRLISESRLIAEWDGLDDLFFTPRGLSPQGKRKLQGFCAAGGRPISLGKLIGLPNEITFDEWVETSFTT